LGLRQGGVLAEQSWPRGGQVGSCADTDGGRLGLGPWRACASLEPILPIRHYVVAGLLGAYRAGLRALVRNLEGIPNGSAGGALFSGSGRSDDSSFDSAEARLPLRSISTIKPD